MQQETRFITKTTNPRLSKSVLYTAERKKLKDVTSGSDIKTPASTKPTSITLETLLLILWRHGYPKALSTNEKTYHQPISDPFHTIIIATYINLKTRIKSIPLLI